MGFRHRVAQAGETRGVDSGKSLGETERLKGQPRTSGSTLGGMEASRRTKVQGFDCEWSGRWDKKRETTKIQHIESSVRKERTDCFLVETLG